jgi:hypothetical protein
MEKEPPTGAEEGCFLKVLLNSLDEEIPADTF